MTPEDRASRAMAECIAKNAGENMAFYLVRAIKDAADAEREACATIFDGYQPVRHLLTSTVADKIRQRA